MNNEFALTLARIQAAITRVPDRLSNPKGEAIRAEYARIFGSCIAGHEPREGGLYLALPFQTSLLTDPVLYTAAARLLVLDHPTRSGQSEFAIDAHVIDLPRQWSLYENRYPRLISCPSNGEGVAASWMINRLMSLDFKGPFSRGAA